MHLKATQSVILNLRETFFLNFAMLKKMTEMLTILTPSMRMLEKMYMIKLLIIDRSSHARSRTVSWSWKEN